MHEQACAAAVQACRQLDVDALLQRLEPAEQHARASIRLVRRQCLEHLIRIARQLQKFHIQIVTSEKPLVKRDRYRGRTVPL